MKEIRELKKEIKKFYNENDIDYILTRILDISIKDLYMEEIYLAPQKEKEIIEIFKKLSEGYPLAYILRKTHFYDLELFIEEGVFIPRPETETFVIETAKFLKEKFFYPSKILDLGCGSGCIALLLKKFFPESEVFASDINIKACKISRINSSKTNLKINVICTDMFSCFKGKFDLIISNPPYVKEGEFKDLPEEVKKEPLESLYGGKDGLEFYKKIEEEINGALKKGGILAIEINPFLKKEIQKIFKRFKILKEISDLKGLKRGIVLEKNESFTL